MTSTITKKSFQYSDRTIERAKTALSCSPFKLELFKQMRNQSVPISTIAGDSGIKAGYTKKSLTEVNTEAYLVWLINVGLLRREVDGQGLTDSFRLTPLGRQIIATWEQQGNTIPQPSIIDRIFNWLNRWLKWSR